MRKIVVAAFVAFGLLSSQMMAHNKPSQFSLLAGVEKLSIDDSAIYGKLDDLTVFQLVVSSDKFFLDNKLNAHFDVQIGGGDTLYPAMDVGLRYQIIDKFAIGPFVGGGIYTVQKNGKDLKSEKRDGVGAAGIHFGVDARYLISDSFVATVGYKKMDYKDADFSERKIDSDSMYLRLGMYW